MTSSPSALHTGGALGPSKVDFTTVTGTSPRQHATIRIQQAMVALVQVLALTTWFSASAVVPALQREWGITNRGAVWVTSSTQVGFVVGAVASSVTNLADRIYAPRLLAGCAAAAAVCTAAIAVYSHSLASAVPLRFTTGVFLAGVYPVGLKVMASWSHPKRRALAFGLLIGALTVGSNLPHLIRLLDLDWRLVMLVAAGSAAVGAVLAAVALRLGPFLDPGRPRIDPRYVVRMFRDRPQRLVNLGYFGHMWELYALWTWFPTFVLTGAAASARPGWAASLGVFAAMGVAGLFGCLVGGWAADRCGGAVTAIAALTVSGASCLLSPLVYSAPWWLLLLLAVIWGAAVIADSGVFSTMLSGLADRPYTGTALTAQTAIGFLLTVVTIQLSARRRLAWLALRIPTTQSRPAGRGDRPRSPHSTTQNGNPYMTISSPLQVGQSAQLTRTIEPDDIALFSQISGDFNPLHYDLNAAKASQFGEIVVQGGVTSAILNAVVAEQLPGPGTVFLNVNWNFKAPGRPGDVITGRVEVITARQDKPITELRTTVTRGDGTVLLEGTAVCYTMQLR